MFIKTDLCRDQSKWPRDTQKQVFLLRVIDQVGRAIHGEDWTGLEPGCELIVPEGEDGAAGFLLWQDVHATLNSPNRLLPFGRSFPVESLGADRFERVTKIGIGFDNQIAAAKIRFFKAAEAVVAGCCDEKLTACLRPLNGGDYSSPIPAALWNFEKWQRRMFDGRMDPANPFNDVAAEQQTQWIFVEAKSVRRFLDGIGLADHPIERTIGDETRCKHWLKEKMKTSPAKAETKSTISRHAMDAFNVSQRGFDRIWGEVIRETGSSWNKAGPLKRSR